MNKKRDVAKRALLFEIEHSQCLDCGDEIIHPLCPYCVARAFLQWLEKFPKEYDGIRVKVERFLRGHFNMKHKSKSCVSCGKNRTYVCPRCFTEYLYSLIKEAGLGVRAMTEFLFMFNFDFDKKSYAKDLEFLGGY